MHLEPFAFPAVILITITSLVLLITTEWQISILSLSIQYVGVFVLVGLHWPFEMAISKLVAGWMAGAVLGIAILSIPRSIPYESRAEGAEESPGSGLDEGTGLVSLPGRAFRLLAAILIGLTVLSLAPQMVNWVPGVNLEQAWGGLILIGMGLLQLGFTARPFQTVLGLLTALAGFEIPYAAIESSTLVAGLLSAVTLGLSLAGAYLLMVPYMEETE